MKQIIIKEKNIQIAYTLLLEHCHQTIKHSENVAQGNWATSLDFCYWVYDIVELFDKTILILAEEDQFKKSSKISNAMGLQIATNSKSTPFPPYKEDIILIHKEDYF